MALYTKCILRENFTETIDILVFLYYFCIQKMFNSYIFKKSIMVESFIVRNYMSYRDQVELSFLASKKEKASTLPPEWYQEIDGKRILRLLLCVGLNGTGKTKMIEALQYLRMLAIYKPQKPTDHPAYRPFLLDEKSKYEPSEFSLTYYINNICYYYYIKVSEKRIEEEILKQQSPNVLLYHRLYNAETDIVSIKFGPDCDISKSTQQALKLTVIQNSSVLSVFGSLNLESQSLKSNYDFFDKHISLIRKSANQKIADKLKTGNPERDLQVKRMLLQLLKDVGTNICDYEVDEITFNISDIENSVPELLLHQIQKEHPCGQISQKTLRLIHSTPLGNKSLDDSYESLGTMNIIKLLLVMFDVVIGRKCSCIDEIEYGIHTKALDFLLKMYLTIADNCQLVVATHDLSLLKSKNLRRDAVRMFEKDEYGVTQIKRKYVHNTMNFFNAYEKILDEQLGLMAESLDSLSKYRELIQTFYKEYEKDKRE